MSALAGSRLRLVPQRGAWRVWDGTLVFFEPLSGDTHRIDCPAGHVLRLVSESGYSKADIQSALSDVATAQKIEDVLTLLMTMELVEYV